MKRVIIIAILLCTSLFVVQSQSLIDDVMKMKSQMQESLILHETGIVRARHDAERLSIDVAGWQDLSLSMWETKDGGYSDEAVWADAILTKIDGTKVRVSEMPLKCFKTRRSFPKRDVGWGNDFIVINGTKYEHGISAYAPSQFVVPLNGEYTLFEVAVGLEDCQTTVGSVVFTVKNYNGYAFVEDLAVKYPKEIGAIIGVGGVDPEKWFVSNDGEIERTAALKAAAKVSKGDFKARVESATGSVKERIATYLEIITDIQNVVDISNRYAFFNLANVERAFEDMSSVAGYDKAKYAPMMARLKELASEPINLERGDRQTVAKAEQILSLARTILLSNSALDNDKIILSRYNVGSIARSASATRLGTQNDNWSNQFSAQRIGFDTEIVEMSFRGDEPTYKSIYRHSTTGPISDLMLSWDASKLLFTSVNDRSKFNIFEVGVDGKGAREVIKVDEPDLEFTDGTFLPNGKYIATSNIGYQGVPCVNGTDAVGNMVLYNPEDGDLRRLTFDQDANWHPVVANNGKVMYVRWEYTDLTHYFSRITMHMNPDGTEQKSLYGSGDYFPNSTFDIQPLPGNTSSFIAIISGHHGVARSGRLMLIDPAKSRKKLEGIVQEIPFSTREIKPIITDGLVNNVWPQFTKPRPVTDKYFLVTTKLRPESLWGVYLVDIYDNMTLVAEAESEGLINAIYLQERVTPPSIPEKVDLDSTESTVYIQDIYEGEGLPGVKRGTVKKLRLFAYEYGYVNSPTNHLAQGIQSGWDIKRLLGEVDVNEDGSVIFKVPANTPISIQPLDADGCAMQWMRSWMTGMPGEVVSCVGCHEDQNQLPLPKSNLASKQQPQSISEWDGGVRPYTFELEIQPILDRACVACHTEESKICFVKGVWDEGIPGNKFIHTDDSPLSVSYLNLHPYVNRQGSESDIRVMYPYEYHASTSELVRMLKSGHHGVELTDEEFRNIYAWIDMNAPYRGSFIERKFKGIDQTCRRMELSEKYANVKVDWKQEIADYAAYLESQGEVTPVMPKEKSVKYKKMKSWSFDTVEAQQMQNKLGETTREIDLGEGVKMVFRRIPAGEFVMGDNSYGKESAPESRVKIDRPFWIGEIEVTNEQYNRFVPEHDSRYIAYLWKDQVKQGFPANTPEQPVIRVSYDQVMEYCERLSAATGVNVTLPTEAQWEWAARAGTSTPFWFGELGSDYGTKENMADAKLDDIATFGNAKPIGSRNPMFKYLAYFPKEREINDKSMIQVKGKSYEANAWGLYDMLGNVREWTKSDYIPYPYKANPKEESDTKVIRGGSWIDRSKNSAAYSRKSAVKWQPLNNTGFRLIIEE
ncbi:MAG: SUMF1/EgtB/PvdO family nonheme iron enzyme [Rikenellaceae bacterium]